MLDRDKVIEILKSYSWKYSNFHAADDDMVIDADDIEEIADRICESIPFVSGEAIDILKKVDHTLTVHGKVDRDTPLHLVISHFVTKNHSALQSIPSVSGEDCVPWLEIESFVKIYNHEKSGDGWSVNSFLTGLRNWIKPKESLQPIPDSRIEEIISEIEDMHPYKQPGNRESYYEYNEGWSDACDILGEKIKAALRGLNK